jgi:hypothetical protein
MLIAALAAGTLVLTMTVAPAFAFIHDYLPAGYCPQPAAHEAADNETAEAQLLEHVQVPVQTPPAPDHCPGNGH